jgi:RHS repeat-associated protein
MAYYRGEQYDPDLGLYYLRARYYNPTTGRFLSVDSLAGQGQRRYEYAAADPVNGEDPSGDFVLESYWPLCCARGEPIPDPSVSFQWCFRVADILIGNFLPPCRPHWIVMVNWRPLYGLSKLTPGHHPLGHWHHTYISIFKPNQGTETWGVLGENNTSKNQEVLRHDPRNNAVGGGEKEIPCADSEAERLWNALVETDWTDSHRVCPSCGDNYHNGPFPLIDLVSAFSNFNSNTYTFNMIRNWGKTPPPISNAPGYHFSASYSGYF